MRYNVEIIKEMVRKNPTTEIIYFWGHTPNPKKITKSCFSQWYDVYFEVDGIQYHTTEQYMRPKISVSSTRATTTPTLRANTAGKNCTWAVHPSQVCTAPVKSRNKKVTAMKNNVAKVILIFRSII